MSFEVNLIKNKVPTFMRRRTYFIAIISYLILCGLILVFLCYKSATNFMEISNLKKDVVRMEKEIYLRSSSEKNILSYATDMRMKLVESIEDLEVVDSILSKRINLTGILQGFSMPLPTGVYIDDFILDSKNKSLVFNVIIPKDEMKDSLNTSGLLSYWKNDNSLMSNIDNMKSSVSQKKKKRKKEIFVSKFSCSLSRGDLQEI